MSKFMRRMVMMVGLLSAAYWPTAQAQSEVDVGLSNDAAMAALQMPLNVGVDLRGSFLHAEEDGRRSNAFGVGFSVGGQTGNLLPYVGAKVVGLDGKGVDAYGVALLAGVDFSVASNVWIGINGAYAPDIVFGGDFDRYYEIAAQVGYQIIPQAQAFIGVQNTRAHSDVGSYRVYSGALVGFKFFF